MLMVFIACVPVWGK